MAPIVEFAFAIPGWRLRFALVGLMLFLPRSPMAESAQVNYALHCMGCHQADGSGMPGKVPTLKGQVEEFLQLPGGREFLVQVPGVAQSSLSDGELADVLNWVLSTFGSDPASAEFKPYSAEEIAALRRIPLNDVAVTRKAILTQQNVSKEYP
jgi:mono/diheme cytochrome c family protein